jgi:triosephosphate isomerase
VRGIRPLVAGNWKMHGLGTSSAELRSLKDRLAEAPVPEADAIVCPPATLLARARDVLARGRRLVGGAHRGAARRHRDRVRGDHALPGRGAPGCGRPLR